MRQLLLLVSVSTLLTLTGCNDSGSDSGPEQQENFKLQLLHLADVDGGGTAAMFNVDEFSALTDHFRGMMPKQTIVVSSGDNYIPGPIFQASEDSRMDAVVGVPGRGETEIQNQLGIQNHCRRRDPATDRRGLLSGALGC